MNTAMQLLTDIIDRIVFASLKVWEFLQGWGGDLVMFLFMLSITALFVSRHFRKIIRKEMDLGGEEYGEIATTKVYNSTAIHIVFSILGLLASIGILVAVFVQNW